MNKYNWQLPDWPYFRYDLSDVEENLIAITEKSGLIQGKLSHLSKLIQTDVLIALMIEEAVKTSAIEGEFISRMDVRSSIKNKLNLEKSPIHDKRAQGVVGMMFAVRDTFKESLSQTQLFKWHSLLMFSSMKKDLTIGRWRTHKEPMQIVSGHYGKQVVRFEAPPSKRVPIEMKRFIRWFNDTAPGKPNSIKFAPVRAAIAHLYFESIHPFEDGSGRIGRAIAEKALFQGMGYPLALSLSSAIDANKKAYYATLKSASRTNEISSWLLYFTRVVLKAQKDAEAQVDFILKKTYFFDAYADELNSRELKVIRKMLDAGPEGFDGGMSAKKYIAITNTSKATATRDLQHLHDLKVVKQRGKGRNVRYELNLEI